MLKAIETVYNGYRFRSKLEARWAVFFDTLSIKYEYEKEGYDLEGEWYLPDFWLPCPSDSKPFTGFWLEIKGDNLIPLRVIVVTKLLAKYTEHTTFIAAGLPDENQLVALPNDETLAQINSLQVRPLALMGPCIYVELNSFLAGWHIRQESMDRAIIAAKSARFDHGEHGR